MLVFNMKREQTQTATDELSRDPMHICLFSSGNHAQYATSTPAVHPKNHSNQKNAACSDIHAALTAGLTSLTLIYAKYDDRIKRSANSPGVCAVTALRGCALT